MSTKAKKLSAVKTAKTKAVKAKNGAALRIPPPPPQYKIEYTPFGARQVQLGYRAAEAIRNSGLPQAYGGSADLHLRYDLETMRRESQAYDRDNGLYAGLMDRFVDNILGEHGFTLQARTGNQGVNKKIEKLWAEEFAVDPEVRGLDDWTDVERLVLRHLAVDGDCGAIKTTPTVGKIQLIEAERIHWYAEKNGTNRVEQGIEVDSRGRPVQFRIADYDAHGHLSRSGKWVPASDFIFVANRRRASQTRGVPAMVSNFTMLQRINDVFDSEAAAWQLLSRIAVAINRRDSGQISDETSWEDEEAAAAYEKRLATRVHDFGTAMIFHAEPGEQIQGVDRNIPGANFEQSVKTFLRLIGLTLGMPLELVLLDWSEVNYSSARASLLQAYRVFGHWQNLLRRRFHTPVYEWKVRQWIKAGRLQDRPDIFDHDWVFPPFPWIDPLKDATAHGMLVDRGQSTYSAVLKARNQDRVDVIEEREIEVREAIEKASAIEAATGEKVPWQIFAGLQVPSGGGKGEQPGQEGGPGQPDEDPPSAPGRPRSRRPGVKRPGGNNAD